MQKHNNSAAPAVGAGLQLRLLGPWDVQWQGRSAGGFAYDKPRALLAYLVMHPGVLHSREHLATLLWPELPADRARSNLRRALHELRQVLEPQSELASSPAAEGVAGFLISSKNQLGWNSHSAYWLDVAAFTAPLHTPSDPVAAIETVEQRIALYRGDFLQGLQLPDAPEFDHWVDARRTQLRQRALQLYVQLAQWNESQGHTAQSQQRLQQALALEPWNEDLHRRLMRLLASHQQTSAALDQYEACKAMLQRELSVEPEPATHELAQAIRRGELMRPAASSPMPARVVVQRHWVCVLACELQTDTRFAEELAASMLAESHGACLEILSMHGGHGVAPQAGLVLAYFGYPRAQEHAPRKALEAAQALVRSSVQGSGLRMRVGVHGGWMVVDPRVHLPDATGQITRHAQALAANATWSEVAASPELHLMLRSANHASVSAPSEGLTPFVGRTVELRQLRLLWEQVRRGEHMFLWLCGEAGLGKSRLIQMHQAWVMEQGGHTCLLRCQPEYQHTPYYPWMEWLAAQPQHVAHSPELAGLLPRHEPLGASERETQEAALPDEAKARMQAALLALVHSLAQQQPLLLVLEDMHWVDASTLEWLGWCLPKLSAPVLLVLSSRDSQTPWPGTKTLALQPLSPRQAEQLICQAAGADSLEAPALQSVLQRCDGIPLYIEEMVRTLRACDPAGTDAALSALRLPGGAGDLPGSIAHLLAVRLESVGPAVRLAQQAACLGRDFAIDLLQSLWDGPPESLATQLKQLEQTGLVQLLDAGRARFRHALIQDAAYQTLTLAERQRIHARLAQLYQGAYRHRVVGTPERLAQHLALAGEPLQAAAVWLDAGRQAASRSANRDAIYHFEAGLAQLRLLVSAPDTAAHAVLDERAALELALQAALGTTLIAVKGYGATDAKLCFARALELSRHVGGQAELFPVMWGMWLGGRSCTPEAMPLELAMRLEQIANATGDAEQRMQMHYAFGNNLFWMARYAEARTHLDQAIALGRNLPAARRIRLYGEDTGVSSLSFLAWIEWLQGRPATAVRTAQAAVAEAKALGHAHTLGFALTFAAVLHRFMDEPREAEALAQELLNHAHAHHLLLWQVAGGAVAGWAAARQGQVQALAAIEQCIQASRQAMLAVEGTFMAFKVDALWHLQDYRACAELAQQAIDNSHSYNDVYFIPDFLRLQGLALQQLGQHKAAADCLQQGLALARQQGAKALELRLADALGMGSLRHSIVQSCPELALPAQSGPISA